MPEPKILIKRVPNSARTFHGFQGSFQAGTVPLLHVPYLTLIMCISMTMSLLSLIGIQTQVFFQMTSLIPKSVRLPKIDADRIRCLDPTAAATSV